MLSKVFWFGTRHPWLRPVTTLLMRLVMDSDAHARKPGVVFGSVVAPPDETPSLFDYWRLDQRGLGTVRIGRWLRKEMQAVRDIARASLRWVAVAAVVLAMLALLALEHATPGLSLAAFPVILVDSATGSDTQASGAGPSTALFGATGATSASGLVVDLSADAPDLSGVATDGSAVIFMSDTNAGSRNFGKITAVDNGAKTVTVSDAFQATNTDAWAIGGKRATIGSTTSIKLFSNNSAAGDAMPGWTVECQSAYTETLAAQYTFRRSGDTTSGPITLRGASGAATMPIITFSNNGNCLTGATSAASYIRLENFELRNTNATKTASIAVLPNGNPGWIVTGLKINHSTNKFWKAFVGGSGSARVVSSEVAYCANIGIDPSGSGTEVTANWVHHCGSHGIGQTASSDSVGVLIQWNILSNNTGSGISLDNSATAQARPMRVQGNTCDSNTSDGITFAGVAAGMTLAAFRNNILSNNGGYGLNFSSGSATAILLTAYGVSIDCNDTYNNTSGAYNPSGIGTNDPGLDPTFTNTGAGDFSIGTNLKAKGFPLAGTLYVGTYSATYSYVDIGAAQRQESSGGGFVGIIGG